MKAMFQLCKELEHLDLSNFNTHNVTEMGWMFNQCYKLKYLNIKNFSLKSDSNTYMMFNMINSICEIIKNK